MLCSTCFSRPLSLRFVTVLLSPWLGTCVGANNYRTFSIFLYSLNALLLFVLTFCVVDMAYITREKRHDGHPALHSAFAAMLARNPIAFLLSLYCLLAAVFVVGLAAFHVYLVSTGQTTNEQLKQAFPDGSPWSQGCLRNWIEMCRARRQLEPFHRRLRQKVYKLSAPAASAQPSSSPLAVSSPVSPALPSLFAPSALSVLVEPVAVPKLVEEEEHKVGAAQTVATSAYAATTIAFFRLSASSFAAMPRAVEVTAPSPAQRVDEQEEKRLPL